MSWSVIINYIENHKNTWKQDIEVKGIKIKQKDRYTIFNYNSLEVDWADPICLEARGIIIKDIDTNPHVVCISFNKFFNIQESWHANIDWSTAKVQDKKDGSIVRCWFDEDQWHWSTNSMIDANEAPSNTGLNFMTLIKQANNYHFIPFDTMSKDYTYTFELVSPLQKIVIDYPYTKLYYLTARNNQTGLEAQIDIGIERPKEYKLNTLDDCLSAVQQLNKNPDICQYEGFVVKDNKNNRIKIKSSSYLVEHHLRTNGAITKTIALTADEAKRAVIAKVPSANVILKWYDYQLAKFENEVDQYINYVRGLYEEYEHDRKAVALTIKGDKLSSFGFRSLGNKLSAHEIVAQTPINTIEKYLEDYHA